MLRIRSLVGLLLGSSVIAACAIGSTTGAPRPKPTTAGSKTTPVASAPIPSDEVDGVVEATDGPPARRVTAKKRRPIVAGFDCASVKAAPTTCSVAPRFNQQTDDAEMIGFGSHITDDGRETLVDLMTFIACSPEPSARSSAPLPGASWDHKTTPERLDLVERRFGVTKDERDHLFKDGMVVSSRLEYEDYAAALQDVHRSQLPLYFSVDALFHAIYLGHDRFLAEIESTEFSPRLAEILQKMHTRLEATKSRYWADTLKDLDIYITVARRLLEEGNGLDPSQRTPSITASNAEIDRLVNVVKRAGGLESVELFGRPRMMDTGQFRPRGHYASAAAAKNPLGADLSHYFRAAMWLSRVEFNIVTRSSQSSSFVRNTAETPGEATLAMAIAELVRDVGALDDLKGLDDAWAVLAGRREDLSSATILDLMSKAKITDAMAKDAPEKLRSAIGNDFVRTARTHYQAQGSPELPVIATLLGPRITNDAQATRPVVHPEVYDRKEVPAVEMTYMLGHDRALSHLGPALLAFPKLKPQLDFARDVTFGKKGLDGQPLPAAVVESSKTDLYSGWLSAIRGLSEPPKGTHPSFMETDAYKDMRVSSAVAAYGQIRHNYVLIVPTTYEEGGCEIPDAYVEPAPAVYSALIDYAKRGQKAVAALKSPSTGYFERLENVLRVLSRIGDRELLGQPLTDEEKRFLAMVIEDPAYRPNGYGPSTPLYNGWYYELFHYATEAHDSAKMVADYFASVQDQRVDYAGVAGVRMGFFVVDTNGPSGSASKPRIAVGPVTRSFQARGPIAPRFSDDEVGRMNIQAPWASSYTAKTPTTVPFVVRPVESDVKDTEAFDVTSSGGDVGRVTIALLDHHRQPVASETKEVSARSGKVRFVIKKPNPQSKEQAAFGLEEIAIRAGEFQYVGSMGYSSPENPIRWQIGPTSGKRLGGYEESRTRQTQGTRGRF